MSRTYKTWPLEIKLAHPDKSKLMVVEEHDHSTGPCTLPKDIKDNVMFRGNCYYVWEWNGINLCCCNLCSKYAYEKNPSKHQRQTAKKFIRNYEKEYLEDDWYEHERELHKLDVLSDEIMQEFHSDF